MTINQQKIVSYTNDKKAQTITSNKVPKLRFPEFSDEWQTKILGDILSIGSGRDYKHLSKGTIPVYGTGGLMVFVNDYLYDGKSICIGRKGTIDKPQFINGKFWTVDTLFYTYDYKDVMPEFLYSISQNINWLKYNEASGVPSLSKTTIEKIKVNIPSEYEQQKIADFLTQVDNHINLQQKKLELLKKYKQGLMQQIFSQKLRFKDDNGKEYPEWEERKLGKILNEYIEKTTEIGQYVVLSSTSKGLFKQSEYFHREIASKDNVGYKVIRKNQIVFSPQNLWMGNININTSFDLGIVSPSYKVFNIHDADINYVANILKSPRMLFEYSQVSEQGASIVRRNLDMSSFFAIQIKLPCNFEQKKIANFLIIFDNKIKFEEKKLEQTNNFKKALLQQMFV